MTGVVRVEVQALIAYGTERYEDAVTCGAIRRFLGHVGAIPAGAWGTLPGVSDQLVRNWTVALDARIDEAVAGRDEMDRVADVLLQMAANLEGTDIVNATTFDVTNQDLAPYLPTADGYSSQVRTSPGGAGIALPVHNQHDQFERPALVIPPGNERLSAVGGEQLPYVRVVEEPLTIGTSDGNDLTIGGGRQPHYENGNGDLLDQFVRQYRSELLQLEALLTEMATGHRMPLSDLIVHAWTSAPEVIRNRADLLHSAANTYSAVRITMEEETTSLARYWDGVAADAFTQHAKSRAAWVGQIQTQAAWLAEEGKKAASMLEGLRNAYAAGGYDRIGKLLAAMREYLNQARDLFNPCSDPESKFLDVVGEFVDFLIKSEENAVELASTLLRIEEQERKERPDLGSRGHDAVPVPQPAVGAGAWTDQGGWQPNPGRPAV